MKNMKNGFVSLFVIVTLFSINSVAINNMMTTVDSGNDINTEYLRDNATFGTSDMRINVTVSILGHLAYIEEYFSVDSESNPVSVMSKRYFEDNVTNNTLSFVIQRPFSQGHYSMVRGVLLLNGKRIYEEWINGANNAHLTYTDTKIYNIGENVETYEERVVSLKSGNYAIYNYYTPNIPTYVVKFRSLGNDVNVPVRITLLKDVSTNTKRFPGAVYKYLEIKSGTSKMDDITISFKVENSWMTNNNVIKSNIRLSSWKDKWYGLNTSITGEDENYTYYSARSDVESIAGSTEFVIASLRYYQEDNVNIAQTHNVVVVTAGGEKTAQTGQTGQTVQSSSPGNIIMRILESFRKLIL